jgi:hypothetical protein
MSFGAFFAGFACDAAQRSARMGMPKRSRLASVATFTIEPGFCRT